MEKELFGAVAVMMSMANYTIYLWRMYRGDIKPHGFTWLVWGLLMTIGFTVQYLEAAAPAPGTRVLPPSSAF